MAFTGTPTVTPLGTSIARITGVSLGASASGTIGLSGSGADIELPSNFPSDPADASLTMPDVVDLRYQRAAGGTQASHLTLDKAAGPPFLLTLANPDGSNASGSLEIYVQYFFSMMR